MINDVKKRSEEKFASIAEEAPELVDSLQERYDEHQLVNSIQKQDRKENAELEKGKLDVGWAALYDAQNQYMHFVPMAAIARNTGISIKTIAYHVYKDGGWKEQREHLNKEIKENVKASIVESLRKGINSSLSIIQEGLDKVTKDCKDEMRAPNLDETLAVSMVFKRLHSSKILEEVEEGQSREALTPLEVIQAFANDPYFSTAVAAQVGGVESDDEVLKLDYDSSPEPDNF